MRKYLSPRVAILRSRLTPVVPGYTTRYDAAADCYRAERDGGLPDGAILAGAFVRLHARSAITLKQQCAHNDFVIARWAQRAGEQP
jgi:hypothetical protein